MHTQLLLLTLLLTACGDALASETYAGEPLAQFAGSITTADGAAVPPDVRVSVLWHRPVLNTQSSLPAPIMSDVRVDGSGTLGQFTVSVFEPPPREAMLAR